MGKQERFYIPPEWLQDITSPEQVEAAMKVAQQLNRALSQIQNRLDKLEKVNVSISGRITSLAVEGRQGLFHITWNRVDDCDGYVLEMFTDSAATKRVGRWTLVGGQTVQWQIAVGNVAITRYFRLTPYRGAILGSPSAVVGGLSVSYGAGESAPTSPPTDPAPPVEGGEFGGLPRSTQ